MRLLTAFIQLGASLHDTCGDVGPPWGPVAAHPHSAGSASRAIRAPELCELYGSEPGKLTRSKGWLWQPSDSSGPASLTREGMLGHLGGQLWPSAQRRKRQPSGSGTRIVRIVRFGARKADKEQGMAVAAFIQLAASLHDTCGDAGPPWGPVVALHTAPEAPTEHSGHPNCANCTVRCPEGSQGGRDGCAES